MLVIPIFHANTKGVTPLKKNIFRNKKILGGILAAVLILAVIAVVVVTSLSGSRVSQQITVAEAQKIVELAFDGIAKNTADGAITILDKTTITVNDISYGLENDVILDCSYTALDVKGALADKVDKLIQSAYDFYLENEETGKKTNATKVSLHVKKDIIEALETATPVSGEVQLHIYETAEGLKLHLSEDMVNTVTGGLMDVTKAIKSTTTLEHNGETVDITNKNTLRTGITDCIALNNYASDKPVTGNKLIAAWVDFKDEFYRNFIEKARWTYLAQGLGTTLSITLFAALMGILLGFLIAVVRCTNQMTGKLKVIDGICRIYLTVMRGTPVMVQLLILFFVFLLPMNVDKFVAAVICFGMNSGAYVAEIVRGGIMSVDKGQIEAGRSLGFNYVQTMFHFVIPQAFKAILPSLANEFITLLKESSVAFYIGVADLTQGGLKIRSITYSNFMPLIAVAVIYLALVMILTKLVSILERRLAKSDH